MQMKPIAAGLASLGRGNDSMLVHMTPGEVAGLQQLALAHGGSLTINPHTGLHEAGFLSSILPMIAGAGLMAAGVPNPWMAAGLVGGISALTSGSLQKGLMAGLGAFGGAGLGQGMMSLGSEAATQEALRQAEAANVQQAVQRASASVMEPGSIGAMQIPVPAPQTYLDIPGGTAFTQPSPELIEMERMAAIKDAAGAQLTPQQIQAVKTSMPEVSAIDKMQRGLGYFTEQPADAFKSFIGAPKQGDKPATGLGGYGGAAMYTGAAAAPFISDAFTNMQKQQQANVLAAQQAARAKMSPTFYNYQFDPGTYDPTTGQYAGRGLGPSTTSSVFPYAAGGTVPNLSQMYPQSNITRATYATSPQTPVASEVLDGYEPKIDPFTGEQRMAGGGLADLHEYAAGGKLLRGPGDGMSDDIPAVIKGPKPQRAALADGEFVVPADVVSHIGNGSTEAGAKRLYRMMDKVRMARTGRKAQGRQINADKFMPA